MPKSSVGGHSFSLRNALLKRQISCGQTPRCPFALCLPLFMHIFGLMCRREIWLSDNFIYVSTQYPSSLVVCFIFFLKVTKAKIWSNIIGCSLHFSSLLMRQGPVARYCSVQSLKQRRRNPSKAQTIMACLYFNFLPQISLKHDVTGAASCRGRFSATRVQYMVNTSERSGWMQFIILAGSFFPLLLHNRCVKTFLQR